MSPIAIYSGTTVIYWSSMIICLAAAAWFFLSFSLYTAGGGKSAAMWVFLPFAVLLSVFFSRLIHWYCHTEQYTGIASALTDYSSGGYCLPGVLLGVTLAAVIVRLLRFTDSIAQLLDALAPGAALGIAIIRLSSLFNNSCRGKITIENEKLQKLPIGSGITTATGDVQYRFATFFVAFMLFMLLAVVLVIFFYRSRNYRMKHGFQKGNVALAFLLFYSALEFVLDSTRYDSSFFRSNGFVSLVQILCAVFLIGILIYYSILSVKANGLRAYHIILWVLFLAAAGVTGYFEYLVQRHGDWYRMCYCVMSFSCLAMANIPMILYYTDREKLKNKEKNRTQE